MPEAYVFDATTVEPAKPRGSTIPDGFYKAWITESEYKPTNSGDGHYFEFTWEILEGEHKGWHVWDRLNVDNPKESTVKYAREDLSAICHATGVLKMQHTGQLHGKPCMIKVIIKKQKGYSDKNEIKGYLPADGTVPNAPKIGANAPGAVNGAGRAIALSNDDDTLPF